MAGPDLSISLPLDSVLLDGIASTDPDGFIAEWSWTKISGPASFSLVTPTTMKTRLKNLVAGIYELELKVTDNKGAFARDTVQVIVSNPPIQLNRPPVAYAGIDKTIFLPLNTVNVDGSGSTDPDGNISQWFWTKISGPASYQIANTNTAQTSIINLVEGVYQFELKVTDAGGLFDLDTIQIEVRAAAVLGTSAGNVLFFFRDPTGGLDAANISVIEGFTPQIILVKVKIAGFPDANIEGVWSLNYTPWCPISSIYFDTTSYGLFNLPSGSYAWTAESVTTNLSGYPVPNSFMQYWSAPHSASGTITVQQGACVIKEIIF